MKEVQTWPSAPFRGPADHLSRQRITSRLAEVPPNPSKCNVTSLRPQICPGSIYQRWRIRTSTNIYRSRISGKDASLLLSATEHSYRGNNWPRTDLYIISTPSPSWGSSRTRDVETLVRISGVKMEHASWTCDGNTSKSRRLWTINIWDEPFSEDS